jgi:hypothetical protein
MITIRIPRHAASRESQLMNEVARCLRGGAKTRFPMRGIPCRVSQHWQLDGNNDWTGSLAREYLTINARYRRDRWKERAVAMCVWLRLWLGLWQPTGAPE